MRSIEEMKEYHREYYLKDREHWKALSRNYYYKNKERVKEYRLKNSEKIKEYDKKYCLENKERKKAYRVKNKEHSGQWQREYYQRNKVWIKEKRYQKELRVGAEASLVRGEIPVAAAASEPLRDLTPQRRETNYEEK